MMVPVTLPAGCEFTDQSVAPAPGVMLPVGRRPHIIKGIEVA